MLIAFEGGEGSGKGTQIHLLQKYLKKRGFDVISIVEPGGTSAGKAIRDILLHRSDLNLNGITEAFLFSASRAQQIREITQPALEEGQIVISDRSFYSTYAYQGYARGLDMKNLRELTKIAVGNIRPDAVILLDLPPEIGIARKNDQNEINRLDKEEMDFHKKVRKGFLELSANDPKLWKVIDATKSIAEIHEEIKSILVS